MPRPRLGRRRGPTQTRNLARLQGALGQACPKLTCQQPPQQPCKARDGHVMETPHSVRYGASLDSL